MKEISTTEKTEVSGTDFKSAVSQFEVLLSAMPQILTEPEHFFAKGLYCRKLFMPAGGIYVSKVHKHESIDFILSGDISIVDAEGSRRIKAPHIGITRAGTKRVGLTHADTVFVNVHALPDGMDENTPIDEIEEYFVCNTFSDYEIEMLVNMASKELEA